MRPRQRQTSVIAGSRTRDGCFRPSVWPNRLIGEIAARQHRLITRCHLFELGLTSGLIDNAVAADRSGRFTAGVYAVGHPALRPLARIMAAVLDLAESGAGIGPGIKPGRVGDRSGLCGGRHTPSLHRGNSRSRRPSARSGLLAAAATSRMSRVAISPEARQTTSAALDRVLEVIDRSPVSAAVPAGVRDAARASALALLGSCDGTADGRAIATVGYAAELLGSIAVDLAADPPAIRRLTDELEAGAAVPRLALGREMLRAGRLLQLATDIAVDVQLSLLLMFTGAAGVSLWTHNDDGEPTCVATVGEPPSAPARAAATRVLAHHGERPKTTGRTLALTIEAARSPAAALIAHGVDPAASPHGVLLTAAAPILAELLDRRSLLRREQSRESIAGVVERRLARLRFDLHDGPQQDVHLLAQDLRLFRDQLRPMIAGNPDQGRVLGRLDDLEAQLVALDVDLRRLSSSVLSPFLAPGSLPEGLAQVADAFAQRTGIVPRTELSGDLEQLSESQHIALLALIREALSNVRKHSDADAVSITISSRPDGVTVEIADNGSGFDPDATAAGAARAGRLGLVGMHERVRMLGGLTQIDSRPGGPTVVSATLPRWPTAAP